MTPDRATSVLAARRMKRLMLLAAVVLATPPAGAAAQSAPATLSCEGAFDRNSDHKRLVSVFGAANVVFGKIDGAEGMDQPATIVNGKDKARRLDFVWMDEKARKIPNVLARAGSTWKTDDGVGVGSSLAEIEKLNGKPFKLSGFEWDYGGYVTDFNGGALATRKGGCHLGLRLEPGAGAAAKALEKVSGDRTLLSNNPSARAVKPVVSEISIGWPR